MFVQPTYIEVNEEVLRKAEAALQMSLDIAEFAASKSNGKLVRSTIDTRVIAIKEALTAVRTSLGWYKPV